mmetsp:Transcript_11278/g.34525  ORF Transcript_11278/g.34525 Transcript_11278/m.34525 type:complete len:432 (+) Transcript_11278:208-1503(+)|eukprot:CAMPEP_0198731924 /NCGR_PEP_ID=MMETSP1475-20131203/32860_1 /TAXON_ID= ORGANISM="Unidentified sp., Strain CCMP1999" /NCGR_SAMPLE_ID=MMETSP1475 /ASSEMBLY_ACC=CAM_ASM_001111 /LENGTH=431 /DNA_ID=CAMNT_0044494949 /DNA_START=146 /DNA_END=1441 /DNA_ORIENTATION=-
MEKTVAKSSFLARAMQHTAKDFSYRLANERIAYHPRNQRDSSKLLVARLQDAQQPTVSHMLFSDVAKLLRPNSLMIMNDSRVIQARLPAVKETGGKAEVLLLRPAEGRSPAEALAHSPEDRNLWTCMVGGKKLKVGSRLLLATDDKVDMTLIRSSGGGVYDVEFGPWPKKSLGVTFGHLVENLGKTPLPPYIRRQADNTDKKTYQTIYARSDGSVAAPTAGLHLSERVIKELKAKNIEMVSVTLHVGAGTFAPISGGTVSEHQMHAERVEVPTDVLRKVASARKSGRPIVAVGTTAVRTMESLYWKGVRTLIGGGPQDTLVEQWEPYRVMDKLGGCVPSTAEALLALADSEPQTVTGETQLLIVPPYKFHTTDVLITNFHQPESTLLMLVAAFLGDPNHLWKIYNEALSNDYRFLSYGDSSILAASRFLQT